MQTLTSPAAVTKRKQACASCRHRKKRCDGIRPACSLCRKWGIRCEYHPPITNLLETPFAPFPNPVLAAAEPFFPLSFGQDEGLGTLQFRGMDCDPSFGMESLNDQVPGYPTPESDFTNFPINDTDFDINPEPTPETKLPHDDVLLELINLFFENCYSSFPCFHKRTFLEEVHSGKLQNEFPMVLYAMIAVAGRYHHDNTVRARQNEWYEQARQLYEDSARFSDHPLRLLQAAPCVMIHAYTIGDFSTAWLVVGKAWRQITALGFNRLDTNDPTMYALPDKKPQIELRKEELRRTLWLHFILDRSHTWPTGWPHAIDERHFKVDLPMSEQTFQAMTLESTFDASRRVPFTRRIDKLILSRPDPSQPTNPFHYMVVSHVLMGRITETIHSVHASPGSEEFAEECEELDSLLTKLRLSIPRAATSLIDASPEDRYKVIWLSMNLNTMAIILHYRSAKGLDEKAANEHINRAVIAARNIVKIVKDASRICIDLVISPHLASSLYIASCVLVIQWRSTKDDSYKDDIDTVDLVFDRYDEIFHFLGLKFKIGLEHDLNRDMDSIQKLKDQGLRGMLADCCKWTYVQEAVKARGLTFNLT